MDELDITELELHLAAGTDLPTVIAALPAQSPHSRSMAFQWGLVLGVIAVAMWQLLG